MAGLAELSHKAQRAAASVIIDHVLSNAKKDREKAFLDIVDFAEKFWGDGMTKENYDKVREAIRHPEGKQQVDSLYQPRARRNRPACRKDGGSESGL